jgi:hypothetical protein
MAHQNDIAKVKRFQNSCDIAGQRVGVVGADVFAVSVTAPVEGDAAKARRFQRCHLRFPDAGIQ